MPPRERHLRVRRTARFYQIGDPSARTQELWVACHGYAQLAADFAKALAPLADDGRVVLVPEGLSRMYLDDPVKRHGLTSPVGASWMTREDREAEITDYVEYLDALVETVRGELSLPEMPVTALGFSQGAATVSRWAVSGQTQLRRLILWSGSPPTDLPTDRGVSLFRGAQLVMVAGLKDRLVSQKQAEHDKRTLESMGLHPELMFFEGGHSLNSDVLRRLASGNQ